MRLRLLLALVPLILAGENCLSQDSTTSIDSRIPSRYLQQVSSKADAFSKKLDKKSTKALKDLRKQEEKIAQKLSRVDSLKARELVKNMEEQYGKLQASLQSPGKLTHYLPHLDSLATSLDFLRQQPQLFSQVKEAKEKLAAATGKIEELKKQFQKAEDIKKFLKERKQYLKGELEKLGLARDLKKLNKQVYYYSQQLNQYKNLISDPKKAERKALDLLSKTKLFKDFMRKNSMLASLFRIPGDRGDPDYAASLAGLQTRAQVNGLIQQQIASAGPNGLQQFQQNVREAESQLNNLKDKVMKLGGGGSDADIPEGFRPNNQKTKTFLQRLEYGANLQSQRASYFFPVTSDIGVSLGYKLNDKSVAGIGMSYKLGWGRGWNNVKLSSEGAGLRSFIDWKLKGSLWISGGYEQNYRSAFNGFDQLKDRSSWQQSGLLGISKQISLKSKLFRKTSIRLLWDFLSYQQVPRTQPLLFRVGYNFK